MLPAQRTPRPGLTWPGRLDRDVELIFILALAMIICSQIAQVLMADSTLRRRHWPQNCPGKRRQGSPPSCILSATSLGAFLPGEQPYNRQLRLARKQSTDIPGDNPACALNFEILALVACREIQNAIFAWGAEFMLRNASLEISDFQRHGADVQRHTIPGRGKPRADSS